METHALTQQVQFDNAVVSLKCGMELVEHIKDDLLQEYNLNAPYPATPW